MAQQHKPFRPLPTEDVLLVAQLKAERERIGLEIQQLRQQIKQLQAARSAISDESLARKFEVSKGYMTSI